MVVKDGGGGHRQRQAEATKDQIARAARALFAEHGYAATTIAAIATAADIPVQTVYSALGSKARILERITGQWMAESQTVPLAEAYLREPDPREQLRLLAALNRRQLDVGSDVIADLPGGRTLRSSDGGHAAPGAWPRASARSASW